MGQQRDVQSLLPLHQCQQLRAVLLHQHSPDTQAVHNHAKGQAPLLAAHDRETK